MTAVQVMADSRRAISIDKLGNMAIWAADNGTKLFSSKGPTVFLGSTIDTKFIVCGDADCWLVKWAILLASPYLNSAIF